MPQKKKMGRIPEKKSTIFLAIFPQIQDVMCVLFLFVYPERPSRSADLSPGMYALAYRFWYML